MKIIISHFYFQQIVDIQQVDIEGALYAGLCKELLAGNSEFEDT